MVQLGERLTASLSRAFDLAAGTAAAPLTEYQSLVTQVEAEMARFQQLVTSAAQGSYPQPEDHVSDDDGENDSAPDDEAESGEDGDEDVLTYLNRPIHVDIPSMQTYCKRVAPPYSSYLPDSAANKKLAAVKKRA
ncbi:unnamed protein product [Phytophthora fragariaefolia]|uniref:Unnamed protein product n=1 Tax=Phytophthora fragariaefolia TaxID=1490495 RepID=A0A9W6XGW8_9STRA|nr:unnamed protein product [Phytophthora fragariaefolia]